MRFLAQFDGTPELTCQGGDEPQTEGLQHLGQLGKEQYCISMFLHPLPEVVSIGLGDSSTLAVLSEGNGRQLFFTSC